MLWIRPVTRSFTTISAVILAVSVLSMLAAVAWGDIPKKISYQGRLTDSSGVPLAGSHSVVFSIYEAADGGSPLWSETKTETADSSGIFSTLLGSVVPIEADFTNPCWLEVQVDGQVLSPRREIASVPFAYQAEHADSAASAAEASNAVMLGGRPAESFADSSVDGHSLDAADGSPEDAVYVDNYGRVGVGTSTPDVFLDVRTLGSSEGGVSPYAEVLGHFRTTGAGAHSAISIDAQAGRDAILYFAQDGASMWDLRNDTDIGDKFQLRWHRGASNVKPVTIDTTGYIGIFTTTPNGPLHIESDISINSGTRLADRSAPVVIGDGDGTTPCMLLDGNQIEQAKTDDLIYINYNSAADVSLAQGGGNVGIGTISPDAKLEVEGQVKITGASPSEGLLLTSGYEGIGTTSPNGPLHVESSISINSGTNFANRVAPLVVGDGDGTAACLLIDGNQIEQSDASSVLHLNLTSPGKVVIAQGGGNVGVGASSPDAKLEVAGQVKITGGSPGAGRVLTSSATGLGTWKAITTDYYISPLKALPVFDEGEGYCSIDFDFYAHSNLEIEKTIRIPIDIPGAISGVPQKVKSLTVCYGTYNSTVTRTAIEFVMANGSGASLFSDPTDRSSSTYTSYTVTEAIPSQIVGSLSLGLRVAFEAGGSITIGTIVLTTTD